MKTLLTAVLFCLALLFESSLVASDSGWTNVVAAKDSRILYVSSSTGRDILGKAYKPGEIADLQNPGKIRAFKSLKVAARKLRKGYPDILLLKRGDEWFIDESIDLKGGRAADAKMTIMAYGTDRRRPKINSSDTVFKIYNEANNVAIIGLYLYAYKRDPASADFAGWDSIGSPAGIDFYRAEGTMHSYLFEDNRINYFDAGITITGNARHEDILIRRNLIQNSYNTTEHSQGVFGAYASVILEENILDHNGWYQQRLPGVEGPGKGQATIFNHNTYFGNSYNSEFRNNLFLRASSIHNKWTSNPEGPTDSILSRNLRMENNFYYAGEVGIHLGGNDDFNTGFRWQDISIENNVFAGIGKTQPTRRNIGWYIAVSDWNRGLICGNYLLSNDNKKISNLQGIDVRGHVSDLVISQNTITGLHMRQSSNAAIALDDFPKQGISIVENRIQFPQSRMGMIDSGHAFDGVIAGNRYHGQANPQKWFKHKGLNYAIENWRPLNRDYSSIVSRVSFADPSRSLDSYVKSIGLSGLDEFFSRLEGQSSRNWDERLTAQSINSYLRAGFGNLSCGLE